MISKRVPKTGPPAGHTKLGFCPGLAKNHLLLHEMAVLGPETRPDGPGLTGSSVSRPNPAKLTLPGPVRPTFGHFRGRPSRPSGCKSVALTTGLRPHGPDGFPGTVAGPLAGPLAAWLPCLAGWWLVAGWVSPA